MNEKLSAERRIYWQKVIAEQSRSGKSASSFCHDRGISKQSFCAWRSRLFAGAPAKLKFALVDTARDPGTLDAATGLELALTNGERLRILPGADAATLRMVLTVLRERA